MVYRQEHPKPQFMRENWVSLNGIWDFEFDFSKSGLERGIEKDDYIFNETINVPFCPESALSGIGYTDFIPACIYRRRFEIEEKQLSERIVLHFGAVDYKATVFVNGNRVGSHSGGYSSFCFDITSYCKNGQNTLTVYCEDDTRSKKIPSGKQSEALRSSGCFYTRTTGIWQTVWLEFTPKSYIKDFKLYPDINAKTITVHANLVGCGSFCAVAEYDGREVGGAALDTRGGSAVLTVPLDELHLWEIGNGRLYTLKLAFGSDIVNSYFGMREIHFEDKKFILNGKSVFQRLVLDQGFYPQGIYTAPSDKELLGDIQHSMAMGFNGARLHEKVFEERFLYHCDRMGYIVWGEYASWGVDISYPEAINHILPEWLEILGRDFNHPAIIGWCPFNETWDEQGRRQCDDILKLTYLATKAFDNTRPCIDTSGNYHVITDVFDLHDYDSSGEAIRERYKDIANGRIIDKFSDRQQYRGEPIFISEYGGIGFMLDQNGWGYGNIPESKEAFLKRLKEVTDAIIDNPNLFGFCYTQLTDVEQECNGLYTYDRTPKFLPEEIAPILSRRAAIEE